MQDSLIKVAGLETLHTFWQRNMLKTDRRLTEGQQHTEKSGSHGQGIPTFE